MKATERFDVQIFKVYYDEETKDQTVWVNLPKEVQDYVQVEEESVLPYPVLCEVLLHRVLGEFQRLRGGVPNERGEMGTFPVAGLCLSVTVSVANR